MNDELKEVVQKFGDLTVELEMKIKVLEEENRIWKEKYSEVESDLDDAHQKLECIRDIL